MILGKSATDALSYDIRFMKAHGFVAQNRVSSSENLKYRGDGSSESEKFAIHATRRDLTASVRNHCENLISLQLYLSYHVI
jgi:hypothetical protein